LLKTCVIYPSSLRRSRFPPQARNSSSCTGGCFQGSTSGKEAHYFSWQQARGIRQDAAAVRNSNPDDALIADCLAFTPTIGPGVSIVKKNSYDLVIGVAINSNCHPDAQVLMQQVQRARDAGEILIYYGAIPSRRVIAYPSTKKEVFRMLEDSNQQPANMMQGISMDHLDILRGAPGERAIYNCNSATCNLYANNLLGWLQSR
jgi:hypothetical protein